MGKKTAAPPPSPAKISLAIQRDGIQPFACARASRFHLHLTLDIAASQALEPTDTVVLTFRDLFKTRRQARPPTFSAPLGRAIGKGRARSVALTASHADVKLRPSFCHVRADLLRGEQSLAGPQVGSAELYLMADAESAAHATGSYLCGRTEFSWNHRDRAYFVAQALPLPPTLDPFCPESFPAYVEELCADSQQGSTMVVELIHGATGLLHAAHVFRAIGEMDRVAFCERVLRRSIDDVIFDKMIDDQGRAHDLDGFAAHNRPGPFFHDSYQGHVLTTLSQIANYFRDEADDRAYAASILERSRLAGEWLLRQPINPGVGAKYEPTGCKVYDGRILQGACEWLNLVHAHDGECNPDHVASIMLFAVQASKIIMANDGWYDAHCLSEVACHGICGNMNVLGGLLAARRLTLRYERFAIEALPYYYREQTDVLRQLDRAIVAALDFITCKQAVLTGERQWIRPGWWGIGHLHEICEEAAELYPGNRHIRDWLDLTEEQAGGVAVPDHIMGFHRLTVLAPLLRQCPEYQSVAADRSWRASHPST